MNNDLIIGGTVAVAAGWYLWHNGNPDSNGPTLEKEDQAVTDNQAWSSYVYGGATQQGYHPELVERSLRKFNSGQYLNGEEYSFMKSATDLFGFPDYAPPTPQNKGMRGMQSPTGPMPTNTYAYSEQGE